MCESFHSEGLLLEIYAEHVSKGIWAGPIASTLLTMAKMSPGTEWLTLKSVMPGNMAIFIHKLNHSTHSAKFSKEVVKSG